MITQNEFIDDISVDTSCVECYDSIRILYMEKPFWCLYGRIDVRDVGTKLGKRNFGGGTLYEEGVTIEVSTGMGGRVILVGKSQRKKPYRGTGYRELYYWIQTNFLLSTYN